MFARSIRQISAASLRGRGAGGIFQRASCRHFAVAPSLIAASDDRRGWNMTAISGLAFLVASTGISTAYCEENTPSAVARENLEEVTAMHSLDTLPVYESDFVAQHNGEDGTRIWMTYGGIVYDVTDFIPNHPGGSEQIMKAAGGAIEPYWHLYRQHFASDLPMRLMEHMIVGKLKEEDQEAIDEQMAELVDSSDDPYEFEPMRHSSLKVHSDTPMNAECPANQLTQSYITPSALFYIRHHHPVPFLKPLEVENYKLKIDLSEMGKGVVEVSLDDIKKLPKVEVTATLQCSGNRRSGFNQVMRTSGTSWGQGAISNAKWAGAKLTDVLKLAGLDDPIAAEEELGMEHVRFHALDGMSSSIGIEKAVNPYGDVIVAYEMNGEPLPRDHGFPLRAIVPGYCAVRNVKWLSAIELSKEEAEGPWQRGLNYKALPPAVTDAKAVDLDAMPGLSEASLFSGITSMALKEGGKVSPGETVTVQASGWAWAGGGRNIVRVDVSGDDGKTWKSATLGDGAKQKFGRAWAWTFWYAEVPVKVREDGTVHLVSKSVDMALNVQPEKCDGMWNVRGLGNNSWFRASATVAEVR
jgi:sulfite oxidase